MAALPCRAGHVDFSGRRHRCRRASAGVRARLTLDPHQRDDLSRRTGEVDIVRTRPPRCASWRRAARAARSCPRGRAEAGAPRRGPVRPARAAARSPPRSAWRRQFAGTRPSRTTATRAACLRQIAEPVAYEHDDAARFGELVHLAEQFVGFRIRQRRIRLVEQEHAGVAGEGAGDLGALLGGKRAVAEALVATGPSPMASMI